MNPPTKAPATPRSIVTMHPPGSRPGISSFAIMPAISPKTIQLSTPNRLLLETPAHLRLLCSSAGRLYWHAVAGPDGSRIGLYRGPARPLGVTDRSGNYHHDGPLEYMCWRLVPARRSCRTTPSGHP